MCVIYCTKMYLESFLADVLLLLQCADTCVSEFVYKCVAMDLHIVVRNSK